jgi:hypothetical protein
MLFFLSKSEIIYKPALGIPFSLTYTKKFKMLVDFREIFQYEKGLNGMKSLKRTNRICGKQKSKQR